MFRAKSQAIIGAGSKLRMGFLSVLVCLPASSAWADLEITASKENKAANNPLVMVHYTMTDPGGTTSLRFSTDKTIANNLYPVDAVSKNRIAPPSAMKVQERDRDLGQTFLTGDRGFKADAVYLRVGPSDQAVGMGARMARVALQFFEVEGTPRVNDNGTHGFLRDAQGHPVFSRELSPQLDDFLEGETYRSIHVAQGVLPQNLKQGDYLTFKLTGSDQIVFSPHKSYAFLLIFIERGQDRSMSLANKYFGTYTPDPKNPLVGHGIRREGGTGQPQAPFFRPDLPDDFQTRLGQQPGTLGFPDVDTFRDLFFAITAVPGSLSKSPLECSSHHCPLPIWRESLATHRCRGCDWRTSWFEGSSAGNAGEDRQMVRPRPANPICDRRTEVQSASRDSRRGTTRVTF